MTPLSWILVGLLAVIPLALLFSPRARRHTALFMIVWLATLLAMVAVVEPDVVDCLRNGKITC